MSLSNLRFQDVKSGFVLTHEGNSSYDTWEFNGALLSVSLIRTFNGIYPGTFFTLIGYNTKIPCFIKDINKKLEFETFEKNV